jgi:hypothetical protein
MVMLLSDFNLDYLQRLGGISQKLSSGAKAHWLGLATPGLKPRPPKENGKTKKAQEPT